MGLERKQGCWHHSWVLDLPEHQKHPERAALRGPGTSLHPSVVQCWTGQSSPTFSPPPPSPHLHLQFPRQGVLGALGLARPLWSLTLPCQGNVPP